MRSLLKTIVPSTSPKAKPSFLLTNAPFTSQVPLMLSDLLSPSSRVELTAGLAISRARYLEAQVLIARCRALFAAAIAPFDLLLTASAAGEAPAGLENTGEAMFNRWASGLLVPCLNLPGLTGPRGLPVGIQLMGALDDDLRLLRCAKWIAAHVAGLAASPCPSA